MIVLDDLDERVTPYWDALPQTAALLRDRGRQFTQAFAPTPICCPGRSTLLTGQLAHNIGVYTNAGDFGGWETFAANGGEDRTFAVDLQAAGYRTGLAGKYLNGIEDDPEHIPPGWSEWYGSVDNAFYSGYEYTLNENGTLVTYGTDAEDYSTDVMAAKSVDFIERAAAGGAPFLWTVNSTAPHVPLPPAPRHADHEFADDEAPRAPNYQEIDVSDKPTWLQESAPQRSAIIASVLDTDHQDRMGSLLAVDDLVAGIYDALARTGELANTYVVLVSDNGYNMGAHRLWQKQAPYEESLRIPLVVDGPGVATGRDDHMVLQADIAPTLLDLAGLTVPADVDGRSLAPLLRGESPGGWRTDFIAQYSDPSAAESDGIATEPGTTDVSQTAPVSVFDVPPWRGVRTDRYLYVEWLDGAGEAELYDLHRDPWQLDNVLATEGGRQASADIVSALDARLDELSDCSGETCS
jgi:arylsulfatase A-like enzyme